MSLSLPVLVFDSGSGGLSVWKEIVALRPDLSTLYCADFEGFPYGTKPDSQVAERVTGLLARLIPRYHPRLVVLACNTASTLLLDDLRQRFDLPFVGVVPAIKTAGASAEPHRICLLATPATITRPYIDQLVKNFASGHEVIKKGQGDLVRLAEDFVRGKPVDTELRGIVDDIRQEAVDAVVLGCTHFPLLRAYFEQALPEVRWIDSGEAIARRVSHLVGTLRLDQTSPAWHEAVYTGPQDTPWETGVRKWGFQQVSQVPAV